MSSVLASAPPRTTAVRPSRLMLAPGCGGTTSRIRQSGRQFPTVPARLLQRG